MTKSKFFFRSFPKGSVGFSAVFIEVGRRQQRPDVRIPRKYQVPRLKLNIFCAALQMLVANTRKKTLWKRYSAKRNTQEPKSSSRVFPLGKNGCNHLRALLSLTHLCPCFLWGSALHELLLQHRMYPQLFSPSLVYPWICDPLLLSGAQLLLLAWAKLRRSGFLPVRES